MKNKGFALVFSMIIATIIVAIIISLCAIASGDLSLAGRTANTIRAYYLAEAGLSVKFAELRAGNTFSISSPRTVTLSTGNTGTYTVQVTGPIAGPLISYKLQSTGTYKGINKIITFVCQQTSSSRFAYLTNTELRDGSPIWFISGDVIRGPCHTNGQLNIMNNPTFQDAVSSVNPLINYYHGGPPADNPAFLGSLTLGVQPIQLPTAANILNNISTAASQPGKGLYLTGDTTITLLSNGTMSITNHDNHWTNHNVSRPNNEALFVDGGDVNISGILSGKLTVGNRGNNKDIYVTNNILYNSDPRKNSSSNDMLGLVSQNNVYVDSNAPNNIEIDACIVALNSSLLVENYDSQLKGTLTVYGGITQMVRGPVGTFNSGTGQRVSGYLKNYVYDNRLRDEAPSYFPALQDSIGTVYTKVSWSET